MIVHPMYDNVGICILNVDQGVIQTIGATPH
jgi:hypothetical protein